MSGAGNATTAALVQSIGSLLDDNFFQTPLKESTGDYGRKEMVSLASSSIASEAR
jgi:hypothetical protein